MRDYYYTPPGADEPTRDIAIDHVRNTRLTDFGRSTLHERYLLPGETPQELFARVSCAYSDDSAHAQRLYDYMSKLWFMPATPVLSNGGTVKGLPISCYLNEVPDDLEGIVGTWVENVWLASRGGGIGTYWGNVRSIGEPVGAVGKTSGGVPFQVVQNYLTLAISQGSQRRGAAAVYLDVGHPEIEEFMELRKPSGDFNRKTLYLHHGVLIPDAFMERVRSDGEWELRSPKDGSVRKVVSARELFARLVETRLQTGEPYLVFTDTVNRAMPAWQRDLGLRVTTSNLCAEITLPTGKDHLGEDRTAVCCLSSVNLETWDEWKDHPQFVEDVMRFLDNVLQDYIDRAPPEMRKAVYSATRERSVGLGVMGFHSMLQKRGVLLESAVAKALNRNIFKELKAQVDAASEKLAVEKGPCPDWIDAHRGATFSEGSSPKPQRFACKMAIAPTASISIICGGASAGIDPIPANVYTHKTLDGSFVVKNPYLEKVLRARLADAAHDEDVTKEDLLKHTWDSILEHGGSVQHLGFLSEHERALFKTSFELDQRWLLDFAADRAAHVCQSQSINLFIPADVDKWDLLMLHWKAWEMGIKSLYYLRSMSLQRAAHAGGVEADNTPERPVLQVVPTDYEECLACQ